MIETTENPETSVTWNGHVETIGDETFHARLMEDGTDEWEMAEIPLRHLSAEDRDILQEGSYMTMTVTRESFSVAVRRIYITPEDIGKAQAEASELARKINWIE